MKILICFILASIPWTMCAQSDTVVRASYDVEYYTLAGEEQAEYHFAVSETGEYFVRFWARGNYRSWQKLQATEAIKLMLWLTKH